MTPPLELDVQIACTASNLPESEALRAWTLAALAGRETPAALTVRIVECLESQTLNRDYRGVDRPTNVLSFPFELPPELADEPECAALLGDLVICAEVVAREACEQDKALQAHWAHMVVHGVLHLLGHDHLEDAEARRMEDLETRLLTGLGFPPPYENDHAGDSAASTTPEGC